MQGSAASWNRGSWAAPPDGSSCCPPRGCRLPSVVSTPCPPLPLRRPPPPCRYSWGSCLAAYALSHPSVVAYAGVSFPLGGLSWVLQTKRHFGEVCRSSHVPRLLLLGDQVGAAAVLAPGVNASRAPHRC
jgi:hypothetical protein